MASHDLSRGARLRCSSGLSLITVAALVVGASAQQPTSGLTTRSVYASVTDAAGRPTLDLAAGDIQVKVAGVVRPFEIRPATEPLRVTLMVSQNNRHDRLLESARGLCSALDGVAEVSVISVISDAETLSGFSDRAGDCLAAIDRIDLKQNFGSHMNPALVEGILETSSGLPREGWRSAIVVLRGGAERPTPLYGDRLRGPIRTSGALLYVASTRWAADQLMQPFGLAMSTIVDGAIESGGRHVMLGFEASVMQQLASEIAMRYRIRYEVPADVPADARLSITSLRPELTVRAPTRISR